ncbi:MAG: DUF4388 domain-containing protein [Planctomycetota bacterium]|nr:DUF4388 domain-containing protein [Planctomycetota bacterium]
MSVRGSTQTVSLVDLLTLIHGSGHAGTLKVQVGENGSKLHFFRGQIYLPTGGSRGAYRIGALLVRAGKLSGRDLLRALQIQKSEGHRERLGDVLVRHRLVTREDLDLVIRAQFEEEICDLLFAENAYYEFRKDVLPAGFADARGNIQALGFDTRSILMEASRRQDEWRRIHQAIPSVRSVYRTAIVASGTWNVAPDGRVSSEIREAPSSGETDLDREVVKRWKEAGALFEQNPFDGVKSVEEVVGASGLPTFVAMGAVARLRTDGLIRELQPGEVEATAMAHLRQGKKRTAFRLYEWANESDRLRASGTRLDKAFLRPEWLDGMTFSTRTSSVRALQILSRLLRRGAPFRFKAREAESAVEVFFSPTALRLQLVGPRRTHSTARYLRRRKAITSDQLDRARRIAAAEGRRLDRVLLEDGFVGRDLWIRAIKDKVVSGMFSIFGWSEPDVEVQGGDVPPPAPSDVTGLVCEIPLDDALRESLRRDLLRWKVLLTEIPTPDVVFLCARPTPDGKPRRAHDLFDGRRSIRDLISLARVAPLELLRFVYDCAKADRIRRLTDRDHYDRVEKARAAGRLDDAITMCKSAMAFGFAPKLYGERLKELRRALLQQDRAASPENRPVLQGDVSSLGLAEVLQLLHQGRRTGTLRVGDGEREKVFYLDDGVLQLLKVATSEADREVWDLIMGDETQHSLDISGLLNKTGQVREEEVGQDELASIKEDIFETFLWEGATYEFTQNLLPTELRQDSPRATKLALRTDRLLIEAMSRLAEWDELKKTLRSERAVFKYASPAAQLAAVQREGLGALAYLFDGTHTLADVVRVSGENRFKIYRLVRDLVAKKHLVLVQEQKRPLPRRRQRPSVPLASGRIPRLDARPTTSSSGHHLTLGARPARQAIETGHDLDPSLGDSMEEGPLSDLDLDDEEE